jgi:hypothetical protein
MNNLQDVLDSDIYLSAPDADMLRRCYPGLQRVVSEPNGQVRLTCRYVSFTILERLFSRDLIGIDSDVRQELLHLQRVLTEAVMLKLTNYVNQTNQKTPRGFFPPTFYTVKQWALLSIIGVLGCVYAACQGMTGLMSFIGFFNFTQTASIIAISLFAVLSAFVFMIYDLQSFSLLLGTPFRRVKSWLKDLLVIQDLLQEGYRNLHAIADNIENFTYIEDIKGLKRIFDKERMKLGERNTREYMEANSNIRSWFIWTIQNLFAYFAATVWALSGYFVGKSAAAVILGFCSYSVMVVVAEPLTFFLSITGFVVAGVSFYKGEFRGIVNHVNYWAGIPENFLNKFKSGLIDARIQAAVLENKINQLFSESYMKSHADLRQSVLDCHQKISQAYHDRRLQGIVSAYKTQFIDSSHSSDISVLNRFLLAQNYLLMLLKIYENHTVAEQEFLMVQPQQAEPQQLPVPLTHKQQQLQRAYTAYRSCYDEMERSENLLGDQRLIDETRTSQKKFRKMVKEFNGDLKGKPIFSNGFTYFQNDNGAVAASSMAAPTTAYAF